MSNTTPIYTRIYQAVRQVPPGKVATYGQIAAIVGGCTPRMVGYALAAVQPGDDVPWQRVINAQGKISLRADGGGASMQRDLLAAEGVRFTADDKVIWSQARWPGPDLDWLVAHGFDPAPTWRPG
jgi:methylated-DNA-protein-cysteine methyltransferase-like protein